MFIYCTINVKISLNRDGSYIFLKKGLKFQPNLCNRCFDFLMMSMNLHDISVLKTKNTDYCCIINAVSQIEALNLMQNTDLTEESRPL